MKEAQFVWSVFLFAGLFLAGFFLYILFLFTCTEEACLIYRWQKIRATNSYEQCVQRGFPVSSSTPPECRAGSKVFVQPAGQGTI